MAPLKASITQTGKATALILRNMQEVYLFLRKFRHAVEAWRR
jgi:hypothetical protein